MTDQHPITPPPSLVEQWRERATALCRCGFLGEAIESREKWLIDCAAQWVYDQRGEVNEAKLQEARDQELEACIEVIESGRWFHNPVHRIAELRAARRPKPPSLKEQALMALAHILNNSSTDLGAETIRRALGALPDD